MVDAAVSFLLQNLPRLLNNEVNLLSGVEAKVNSLHKQLNFIDIFLKSSMGKRNDDVVKEVLNQIRDVAYKAEDVVEIYISNVTRHRQRSMLSRLFHSKDHAMMLHEVDTEIEKIKISIDDIYKNKDRYGITEGDFKTEQVAAAEWLRERRRDVEEKDVVGLVHDSRVVIEHLMEGDSDLKVVSIIGMGGLGKTTLARKIYNSIQVKGFFPHRAWGYVSNDYRPRELFLSFLQCLLSKSEYDDLFKKNQDQEEADAMSDEKLKKKLRECLKGKKYLVVLDDIWKTQVWDEVKRAFPNDQNGSRILITSRMKEVAHYTGTSYAHDLPLLNEEESWELFSKKVFRGKECPSNLESLGRAIAESCKGLPLAIEVLAGLVAKKEISQREWLRMKKITWHLTQDKFEAMDILKLSYDSLPRRLKPCFLYFAIYPEDYKIRAREVVQMWIAEGFIQPHEVGISSTDTTVAEEIGDYYLDELVDRSLVQVASRSIVDGGVKSCRIHDLLRDLCISESKSDKFLQVCTEPSNIDTLFSANPRKLSFHCGIEEDVSTKRFNQLCTRSIFFFSGHVPGDVQKRFKLARVLYSSTHSWVCIDWKMMINLRYLKIGGLKDIPDCISSLWNLETLDVVSVRTVSSEIWKHSRLKHLYLRDASNVILPKSHGKIKINMQTLWLRLGDPKKIPLLLKINIFTQLKKLVLSSGNSFTLPSLSSGNSFTNSFTLPSLSHLSNLLSLKIIDGFDHPSDPNAFPSNLTKITLKVSDHNYNIFTVLGRLTNLRILKVICRSLFKIGYSLNFCAEEFPQLEVFVMRNFPVPPWTLEKGAMPQLRHVVIDDCEDLDELPEELWCMTTSPQVHVVWPNKRLARSLRNVDLKNGSKLIISDAPWRRR